MAFLPVLSPDAFDNDRMARWMCAGAPGARRCPGKTAPRGKMEEGRPAGHARTTLRPSYGGFVRAKAFPTESQTGPEAIVSPRNKTGRRQKKTAPRSNSRRPFRALFDHCQSLQSGAGTDTSRARQPRRTTSGQARNSRRSFVRQIRTSSSTPRRHPTVIMPGRRRGLAA